jgi:hypothetical protein
MVQQIVNSIWAMDLILDEGKDPREAIKTLMLRPGKDEQ